MDKNWTEKQWLQHWELVKRNKFCHLLHAKQKEVIDFIKNNNHITDIAIYSTRKFGKSMMLCIYGIEHCLQNPDAVVRHVLPTLKGSKDVVVPIMDELMPFIPREMQPTYYASTGTYKFKNGASYILCGGHRDSLDGARGPRCTLLLADEVAFFDAKSYDFAMNSVFRPQMTLVKNPKIVYATTPPISVDHPFITETMPYIKANGALFHYTIWDSPLISKERIEEIKNRLGENSNSWRREYMAELIADDSARVVPEFNEAKHVTNEYPPNEDIFGKRTSYTGYQVADYGVGKEDFTGILAAVFDHNAQQVVVTGERLMYRPVINEFVNAWREDRETYLNACYVVKGTIDAFESLRHSLRVQEGLDFLNPRKGKITDNVAFLRNCFENDKIRIHESCKNLITQLNSGVWDDKHKEFDRSETLGHLDLIACLVYLIKAVDFKFRPEQKRINLELGLNKGAAKRDAAKKIIHSLR